MPRIFSVLVALDALFLVVSYILGCTSRLTHGVHNPETRLYWYHFLSGLTTNVLTLLVHCLIFTYFLGTGRWVKEVTLAYQLPDEPLHKMTRELKRRVFPPALYAMLFAIASGATGAAAHVGVWPWYYHYTLATCTLIVNFWAFRIEFQCLRANVAVLRDVLIAVDEIRTARGLPTNEMALQEEQ
jgi:hypothetical protein